MIGSDLVDYGDPTHFSRRVCRSPRDGPATPRLWDPCCGPGNIVNVLRAAGHEVIGSDLVDYGDPTHFYRRDFLMERKAPDGCEGVITNPPFKWLEQFVAHALELRRLSSCCFASPSWRASGAPGFSKAADLRAFTSSASAFP